MSIQIDYPWLTKRGGPGSGKRPGLHSYQREDGKQSAKPNVGGGVGFQALNSDQKKTVVNYLLETNTPKQIKRKGQAITKTIKLLEKQKMTTENQTKLESVLAMRDLLIAALKQKKTS